MDLGDQTPKPQKSSASQTGKPNADQIKAAITALVRANSNSAAVVGAMEPGLLAGVIVRHTVQAGLPAHPSVLPPDDFPAIIRDLPRPTDGETVLGLIKTGSTDEVVLWRGANPEAVRAMVTNMSAGGVAPDSNVARPSEDTAVKQVGRAKAAIEFTTDTGVQGFHRGNWLIVVKISAKYLWQGSGSESGWVAAESAPIEVLAVVDRTLNRPPVRIFNAS